MTHDTSAEPADDLLWLEEIHGEPALEWVREQNERSEALLVTPRLERLEAAALEVMDSDDRIPMVSKHGEHYYGFWRDAEHPRGLFRRTTWESWLSDEPHWDVILDLDVLAEAEGVPWVWGGVRLLRPQHTDGQWRRMLIALSPDGGDARRYREFDLLERRFVPAADGGFDLPAAKTSVSWLDRDTLLVGTDTGPGSTTASSYPAQVRRLSRGQDLPEAPVVFEVPLDHIQAWVGRDHTPGFERTLAVDAIDFFRSRTFLFDVAPDGGPVPIDVPETVEVDVHRQWLLLRPQERWEHEGSTYEPGDPAGRAARAVPGRSARAGRRLRPGRAHEPAGLVLDRLAPGAAAALGRLLADPRGRARHLARRAHAGRRAAPLHGRLGRRRRGPAGRRRRLAVHQRLPHPHDDHAGHARAVAARAGQAGAVVLRRGRVDGRAALGGLR